MGSALAQDASPWADVDIDADIAATVPGEPRYITSCRHQAWRLCTWARDAPTPALHHGPARCRSWRHEGPCARWRASVDWRRISDAFAPKSKSDCVYLVLNFARSQSPDGPHESPLHRWANPHHVWAALGPRMWRLLHRLQRMCCRDCGCEALVSRRRRRRKDDAAGRWRKGDAYGEPYAKRCCRGLCDSLQGRYVAVVEQHKAHGPDRERWPHLNIVVCWPWLARLVQRSPVRLIPRGRKRPDGRVLGPGPLLEAVVASGFGYQSCAEIVNDKRAVAGYLVKHAAAVERVAGEVAKLSQSPIAAPDGFRRIRSGRGFLAPCFKTDADGALIRRVGDGEWRAVGRRRRGELTYCSRGPPTFRPGRSTLWLDMENRRVYPPSWPGWAAFPDPLGDAKAEPEGWVLHLDLRSKHSTTTETTESTTSEPTSESGTAAATRSAACSTGR